MGYHPVAVVILHVHKYGKREKVTRKFKLYIYIYIFRHIYPKFLNGFSQFQGQILKHSVPEKNGHDRLLIGMFLKVYTII